jgi:pSer/pThr/pTyr-binding forkhead associated (FHA) protein
VTGISPDVDLTSVDEDRSSSRRHAKIYREGETYFVVEDIGATNGTYVNSKRIQAGVPAEIRSGDAVRFGMVELTFFAE